jgi:MoaA/NifB/PqqE/SkfB family radical SAM enzyme
MQTDAPQSSPPVPGVEYHRPEQSWRLTPQGAPRGYIQPHALDELWFHTGTACNLSCPFCLEGSAPRNHRLQQVTFDDVEPLVREALTLGVRQFSFTGGEPFINKDFVRILALALTHRPTLVLTNGTRPLARRFDEVLSLRGQPHAVRFRISLDHPDPARHDAARGEGNFALALDTMRRLHDAGFGVSVARLAAKDEDAAAVDGAYAGQLARAGLPRDTHIVKFPEFYRPGDHPAGVPHITEDCMTTHHNEATRAAFMCGYSKMVVKKDGRMRVFACTLVDDDERYDLGGTLTEAMRYRVMLAHHRCFSCFACGASCSE